MQAGISYSAYNCHLSPLVCPPPSTTYDKLPSTASGLTDSVDEVEVPEQEEEVHDDEVSDTADNFDNCSDEDEDVEVVDESSSDEECLRCDTVQGDFRNPVPGTSPQSSIVCHMIPFFQLCYKLSDRAITLLLVFLRGLLFWIALIIPAEGQLVRNIMNSLPTNVYFLKKYLNHKNPSIRHYVVCPKCCSLYEKIQFPTYHTVLIDIPKCDKKSGKGNRLDVQWCSLQKSKARFTITKLFQSLSIAIIPYEKV